jgi:mono/diheme cytochrome c family protein
MKLLLVLICLLGALSGCTRTEPEMDGKALYEKYCARCHKSTGKGNFLLGVPPNKNTQLSYWEIKNKIRNGSGKHSKMPTFKHLSDAQAGLIANYLMSLK